MVQTILKQNKIAAILFSNYCKNELQNIWYSNELGFPMFGILAPTVYGFLLIYFIGTTGWAACNKMAIQPPTLPPAHPPVEVFIQKFSTINSLPSFIVQFFDHLLSSTSSPLGLLSVDECLPRWVAQPRAYQIYFRQLDGTIPNSTLISRYSNIWVFSVSFIL